MWLSLLLKEMLKVDMPVTLLCDNAGCLANLKNHMSSVYTKHIHVAYHSVRERVLWGQIDPVYANDDNIADVFTKPLVNAKFSKFALGMGLS